MLVVGHFLIKSDKEEIVESAPDQIVPEEDISVENFNYFKFDTDKGTTLRLKADKSSKRSENEGDIYRFEKFNIKYQQENGLNFDLEGKNGEFDESKGEIRLSGELKGLTDNGYRIYADHILFKPKDDYLKSDGVVTIVGAFFKIRGKGLFIDLKKETLKILSDVHSTFDKESLNI